VCYLQPEPESVVVGVGVPRPRLAFEGGKLPCYVCEVSGEVLCGILIVSWLDHALRVRTFADGSRGEMVVSRLGYHQLTAPFIVAAPEHASRS
jgi:hypothetical protein